MTARRFLDGSRWRQRPKSDKPKEGSKANLSLVVSVAALAVSLFSAFYSLVDERYELRMASSFAVPEVIDSIPPLIKSEHVLTFINNGNRPVAINSLALIVQPTTKGSDQLDRLNCEIEFIGPNVFQRAFAKFVPFTIKAGEIETRVFSFAAAIENGDTSRFRDSDNPNHLLSCIQVGFVSAQGTANEVVPYAWAPKASGFGRPFFDVQFFHHSGPVILVKSRWPFKPDPVASE